MYLMKLALRPWRLAPLSQVFTAMAVGFLLLMAGFLSWMERGLRPVVARLQSEQVITAYLDPSVEPKDESRMLDTIRASLGASAKSADVKRVGVREFIDDLKPHYPEMSRQLEDLGAEANLVVPRHITIAGMLDDVSVEKIRTIPGVESADSSRDRFTHIVGAFKALRWVSRLLVAGLCLALFTGLIHLSKMNSYLHQDALALLRLWGASGLTLRAPGMISAFWVGLGGGMLALVGWIFGGAWLARQVLALSPMLRDMPAPTTGTGLALLGCGIAVGLLAGALGSIPRGESA